MPAGLVATHTNEGLPYLPRGTSTDTAAYDPTQHPGLRQERRGPVAVWRPGLGEDSRYWLILVTLVDQFASDVRVAPQLPIGAVRY